jgi:hypothetical protein
MRSKLFLAAALLAGTATSLSAQTTITPFVGATLPMRSMLVDTSGSGYFRMQAQTIYGVAISKSMSPRFGLALAAGAGTGELEAVSGGNPLVLRSSLWFADLRARLRVMGNDDADLGAVFGAGWTQYSMGLFDAAHVGDPNTELKGTFTAIVGLGTRAKLGSHLTLAVSALDRIHKQGIDAPGLGSFEERTQHDMTFAAGLAFPLGH